MTRGLQAVRVRLPTLCHLATCRAGSEATGLQVASAERLKRGGRVGVASKEVTARFRDTAGE